MPATASEGLGVDSREWRGRAIFQSDRRIRTSDLSVPVELRRPVQGQALSGLRHDGACHHARRKGRRPAPFAFSLGKRPQSRGKSGRTLSRRTRRNPWKSRCFRCKAARLKIVVSPVQVRVSPSPKGRLAISGDEAPDDKQGRSFRSRNIRSSCSFIATWRPLGPCA